MDFTLDEKTGIYAAKDDYRTWAVIPVGGRYQASYKRWPDAACIFVSPTEAIQGQQMIRAVSEGKLFFPYMFSTAEEAMDACRMKLQVLQRTLN